MRSGLVFAEICLHYSYERILEATLPSFYYYARLDANGDAAKFHLLVCPAYSLRSKCRLKANPLFLHVKLHPSHLQPDAAHDDRYEPLVSDRFRPTRPDDFTCCSST